MLPVQALASYVVPAVHLCCGELSTICELVFLARLAGVSDSLGSLVCPAVTCRRVSCDVASQCAQ